MILSRNKGENAIEIEVNETQIEPYHNITLLWVNIDTVSGFFMHIFIFIFYRCPYLEGNHYIILTQK